MKLIHFDTKEISGLGYQNSDLRQNDTAHMMMMIGVCGPKLHVHELYLGVP